jgi:glutaminyl-tRNA synthetase
MTEETKPVHFIQAIIEGDIATHKHKEIITRFPPEPNGYLHIGHAKSICLNFGMAEDYKGRCNLRFDDTNPAKEEDEYVRGIKEDLNWLGYKYEGNEHFASDYFENLYEFAVQLIKAGKAYVDDLNAEEIREHRGTLTEPGIDSPHRTRTIEENLTLFSSMRAGDFPDGSKTLRAKIDMSSGNLNMRDPVMYRILKAPHHRTGDSWCIYPMYDWAHGQSDSIEGITHSICTLEFEDHRPLYDWFLDALEIHHPQQIEFARLNLTHTILSKRKLIKLVNDNHVSGWDDPRMPTLSGMRRRGFTADSIRAFCQRIGMAKSNSTVEIQLLEHCLREDLNKRAPRVMGVLRPLKVVIENYPEDQTDEFVAINSPEDESMGTRMIPFSREIYIEQSDFMEEPPKKFFRLAPGREVRLKHGYIIKCERAIKNEAGEVTELRCTLDPLTRSGETADGRKIKGTLHWVSARHAIEAEVRLYDYLLDDESELNSDSLEVLHKCYLEPSLADAEPSMVYQFMRLGYFCLDNRESTKEKPVWGRTITLKDTWAKIQKKK